MADYAAIADPEEGWTKVTKPAKRSKQFNTEVEFAVELLPAYKDGLAEVVQFFGVDTASRVALSSYVAPYLIQSVSPSQCNLPRKTEQVPYEEAQPLTLQDVSHRGFVNVCKDFVHASLAFVNPPKGMDSEDAPSFIRNELSQALESIANQDAPELLFSKTVHLGEAGQRRVCLVFHF